MVHALLLAVLLQSFVLRGVAAQDPVTIRYEPDDLIEGEAANLIYTLDKSQGIVLLRLFDKEGKEYRIVPCPDMSTESLPITVSRSYNAWQANILFEDEERVEPNYRSRMTIYNKPSIVDLDSIKDTYFEGDLLWLNFIIDKDIGLFAYYTVCSPRNTCFTSQILNTDSLEDYNYQVTASREHSGTWTVKLYYSNQFVFKTINVIVRPAPDPTENVAEIQAPTTQTTPIPTTTPPTTTTQTTSFPATTPPPTTYKTAAPPPPNYSTPPPTTRKATTYTTASQFVPRSSTTRRTTQRPSTTRQTTEGQIAEILAYKDYYSSTTTRQRTTHPWSMTSTSTPRSSTQRLSTPRPTTQRSRTPIPTTQQSSTPQYHTTQRRATQGPLAQILAIQSTPSGLTTRSPTTQQSIVQRYQITIRTGTTSYAGTQAGVFCTLYGTKRTSSESRLYGAYTPGSYVAHTLRSPDLGRLTRLRVRHDNRGYSPDWYLLKVVVRGPTGITYRFNFYRWLSISMGRGIDQTVNVV